MLTLLRKIRKSLINSGKARRYLVYAIGEILLVVIGILIALQINNWNENNKTQIEQLNLLASVKKSLIKSSNNIQDVIQRNKVSIESYEIILDHLESGYADSDTLTQHFARITNWSSPFFDLSAYETLKNKGSEYVHNEKLRESIIQIFEQEMNTYVNDYDRAEWETSQSVVRPIFIKYFRTISYDPRLAEPNDYERLRSNDEFENMLTYLMYLRHYGIRQGEQLLLKMEALISEISQEL